jgi:hypothetical protein
METIFTVTELVRAPGFLRDIHAICSTAFLASRTRSGLRERRASSTLSAIVPLPSKPACVRIATVWTST